MRIGLDGIPLTELKTGVGTYTFELAQALAAVAPFDEFQVVAPRPFVAAVEGESCPVNLHWIHSKPNLLTRHWWTFGLRSYIRQNPLDLFHGTNFEVPLWSDCATVITIHDLSLIRHSNTHEIRAVLRSRVRLPRMVRKATMIVTPSETVRADVCEHFKIDVNRVIAVPLAPSRIFKPLPESDSVATKRRLGIEDDFLLFVGTLEPRKNLIMLIRAFEAMLRSTDFRLQLVIVGKMGWKKDELQSYIATSGAGERIKVTGYLPEEDLGALYSSCQAFIYPSIHEGFGLPPLEAMACGAPVIASRVPSVLSLGDTVVRLVSPEDVDDMTKAIVEVLSSEDLRQRLSDAGLRHAATFNWETTAASTREVYDEALRRHDRLKMKRPTPTLSKLA
jgi:glycosyltransferase involved in cell wall biosynthesis